MSIVLEALAFAVSFFTFLYGVFRLQRKETPKYFFPFISAAGCYTLEEVWVIVNALWGRGALDGLLTVRLFGFFGCLCFLLSANAIGFDKLVDEGNSKKAKLLALFAPGCLLTLFCLYMILSHQNWLSWSVVLGFLTLSPALFGAYFSAKHLLLPKDPMGFLTIVKGIDGMLLLFYVGNFLYPLAFLYWPKNTMCVCDLILTGLLLGIILLCGKGADKWKTLI